MDKAYLATSNFLQIVMDSANLYMKAKSWFLLQNQVGDLEQVAESWHPLLGFPSASCCYRELNKTKHEWCSPKGVGRS